MSLITDLDVLEGKIRAEAKAWKNKCLALEAEIDRLKSERRWIPVSERLPRYDERVVSLKKGAIYDEFVMGMEFWMPRPTPPEDEL